MQQPGRGMRKCMRVNTRLSNVPLGIIRPRRKAEVGRVSVDLQLRCETGRGEIALSVNRDAQGKDVLRGEAETCREQERQAGEITRQPMWM